MCAQLAIARRSGETLERAVERSVRELCTPYGSVTRVTVTVDNAAGSRSGVAIADLQNPAEVNSVASSLGALVFGSGALFFFREDTQNP